MSELSHKRRKTPEFSSGTTFDAPLPDGQYAADAASKLPLAEVLAERIANAVIKGEIAPGEHVREQDLGEMFGISRGPVREALRILEGDGFVRIEPYRGAKITMTSEREVQAALEMQIALFSTAARLAAEYASEAEIAEMQALAARLQEIADDPDTTAREFMDVSLETTWLVIHAGGSERLSKTIRSLRRMTRPDRWVLGMATKARKRKAAHQWVKLVEAIHARDVERAETLARIRVRQLHRLTRGSQ